MSHTYHWQPRLSVVHTTSWHTPSNRTADRTADTYDGSRHGNRQHATSRDSSTNEACHHAHENGGRWQPSNRRHWLYSYFSTNDSASCAGHTHSPTTTPYTNARA